MIISVVPHGRLANRMIAYVCAYTFGLSLGVDIEWNVGLPEWGMNFDADLHRRLTGNGHSSLILHDKDLLSGADALVLYQSRDFSAVVFDGLFQRRPLFAAPDRIRAIFSEAASPATEGSHFDFADDELAIHIRSGDIVNGVSWYPLVPISFYRSLVDMTQLKPAFIGQFEENRYCREILDAFPGARVAPPASPVVDFNRIRRAKNIAISVSTYSWLAAWLSHARTIHYPLLGFLHPKCLRYGMHGFGGIDLTPIDDIRYRYHLFPHLKGSHEDDFLDFTNPLGPISKEIPVSVVKRLQGPDPGPTVTELSVPFNEPWYLKKYLLAAWEISEGWYADAASHFALIGRQRGYSSGPAFIHPSTDNVALNKPASQSSTSQWSNGRTPEQDAARAVDGNSQKAMAFHTAKESSPWWMVDLLKVHEIECINIFNRRSNKDIRKRAVPLAVDLSLDGVAWVRVERVHEDTDFGTDGQGTAVPHQCLTAGRSARFVKLTVLKEECFHLAEVEVHGRAIL